VTYHGFYDENLDFTYLERIQIVASMNPSTTVGRHILNPRFTANVHVAVVDYPPRDELITVYSQFLKTILNTSALGRQTGQADKLATAMVDLFLQAASKFSIDEHRHYLFTPRDLT
jgi:dynein heavy chain 2